MSMLLSICTPSIPRRAAKLAELSKRITPWLGPDIEWLVLTDERPSGPKRNEMMDAARGRFLLHLDDDDALTFDFHRWIKPALEMNVDLVMYDALASFNGSPPFRVITGIDHPNEQPCHLPGGRFTDIKRKAWHWCSWRTTLARRARFPEVHHGAEDAIWLNQMYPQVRTWHKINLVGYMHNYSSADSAFDGPTASP